MATNYFPLSASKIKLWCVKFIHILHCILGILLSKQRRKAERCRARWTSACECFRGALTRMTQQSEWETEGGREGGRARWWWWWWWERRRDSGRGILTKLLDFFFMTKHVGTWERARLNINKSPDSTQWVKYFTYRYSRDLSQWSNQRRTVSSHPSAETAGWKIWGRN